MIDDTNDVPFSPLLEQPDPTTAAEASSVAQDPQPAVKPPFDPVRTQQAIEGFNRAMAARDAADMAAIMRASKADPRIAGEAQSLGAKMGLEPDVVAGNIDKVREAYRKQQLTDLQATEDYPTLRKMMLDQQFADVAARDTTELAASEGLLTEFQAGWVTARQGLAWDKIRAGGSTPDDLKEAIKATEDLLKLPSSSAGHGIWTPVYGLMRQTGLYSRMAAGAVGVGAGMAAAAAILGSAGPQAFIPEEVVSVPGMFWAGFRATMMTQAAAVEGGSTYQTLVQDYNLTHEEAAKTATIVGLVNGGLEYLGMGALTSTARREVGAAISKSAAKSLLTNATLSKAVGRAAVHVIKDTMGEVATEVMQEVSSIIGEGIAVRGADAKRVNWEAFAQNQDVIDRLGNIVAETVRGTILMSSFGPAMGLRRQWQTIKNAERMQDFYGRMRTGIEKTEIAKSSPNMLAHFLATASEGTPVETLYVTKEEFDGALKQSGMTEEQLGELSPDVLQARRLAEHTGMVSIPTSESMTKFLTTPFGESLSQNARVDPDGPSVKQMLETSAADQTRIIEEAKKIVSEREQAEPSFRKNLNEVQRDIQKQLEASGRPKGQASVQATFYGNLAALYSSYDKMDVLEWHKQHGMGFTNDEPVVADGVLGQEQVGPPMVPAAEHPMVSTGTSLGDMVADYSANLNQEATETLDGGMSLGLKALGTDVDGGVAWAAKNSAGEVVATGAYRYKNGRAVTDTAFVVPTEQRRGIYTKVLKFFADRYGGLTSSTDLSPGASAAWEKAGATKDADGRFTIASSTGSLNQEGIQAPTVATGVDTSKRGTEQHRLAGTRKERVVGETSRLSAAEKAAIDKAIADNPDVEGLTKKALETRVREHKLAFPVADGWAPLVVTGVDVDKKSRNDKGQLNKWEPKYKTVPYSFDRGTDGKTLEGKPLEKRVSAIAARMHEEMTKLALRAAGGDVEAKKIIRQAGWYREMRTRLRHEFGGLGDLFADLLGAASPNTPVRENWAYAVDVLRRSTKGDFDELMPKWVAWDQRVRDLELKAEAWFNEQLATGRTKKDIKSSAEAKAIYSELADAREMPDELIPLKEPTKKQREKGQPGAKYGFNGKNIVRALLDLWRTVKEENQDIKRGATAPKALNFSGNLIGFRPKATIDVWAARLLQRMAGEKRVPGLAESGVAGSMLPSGETAGQFRVGQDIFEQAVALIRGDKDLSKDKLLSQINDDDLQAIVWFLEKEHWTINSWTSAAGEGGSFEFEADLTGQPDTEAVKELRKVIDSSLSTSEEKAAATAELKKLERAVDRFVGMVSQQRSASTQGADFIPTDADQAQLQGRLHTAALEDPDNRVVAAKVTSTMGLYGDPERSIDLEVVSKQGYNPAPLWKQLLTEALAADQDAVALSRVLRDEEEIDYRTHRPGVEVYFRTGGTLAEVQPTLDALRAAGVSGYTVITDGRRDAESTSGAMPPVVGIRFQFSPEMEERWGGGWTGLTEEQVAEKVRQRGDEMDVQADTISKSVPGVSLAKTFWYETKWAFRHQYEEQINGLTSGRAEAKDQTPGSQNGWRGESVSEGVASAAVRRGEAERASAERAAGTNGPAGDGQVPGERVRQAEELNAPGRRGSYFPHLRMAVLRRSSDGQKGADATTVIHEMSHWLFFTMLRIARKPGAPAQVRADVEKLLSWFGETSGKLDIDTGAFDVIEQFASLPKDVQVEFHEQLAYSFEVYAMEGKAPTPKLASVFARMRLWFIRAYSDIKRQLSAVFRTEFGRDLPELSDEVRGVFDRMLASQQAIEQGEAVRSMRPLYESKEQFLASGYTDDQWEEYRRILDEAHEKAITDVTRASMAQMRWLRNARSKVLKQMQKGTRAIRKAVRERVAETVKQEPVYMTAEILRSSGPEGKLNLEEVYWMLPNGKAREEMKSRLGVGKNGMLARGGMMLDEVSLIAGFDNAGDMLQQLANAKPIEEAIDERTDEAMMREHGDLVDPAQIERAVEKALHSEARARFVATELKFLSKATQPTQLMLMTAKDVARRTLGNTKLRNIRPDRFAQAEAANAREAEKEAGKSGGDKKAVEAKRRQLLNNVMTRVAIEAREMVEETLGSWKKSLLRSQARLAKTYNVELANTARWILSQFGLMPGDVADRTQNYLEMVQAYDPGLFADVQQVMQWAASVSATLPLKTGGVRDYKDLTLDQFEQVKEAVEELLARASLDRTVLLRNERVAAADVGQRLHETVADDIPDRVAGEVTAYTKWDKFRARLFGTKANLTRVEHLFRSMDGGKDGDWMQSMFHGLREALSKYRVEAGMHIGELVKVIRGLGLKSGTIAAPELNYTFGSGANGRGMSELLGLLTHMGNESNMAKALVAGRGEGNRWADVDMDGEVNFARWYTMRDRLVASGVLTKGHFDAVQAIWDRLEQIKPTLQAAHHELFGYFFKEVPAKSFSIEFPDGTTETYRGGYVPAIGDRDLMGTTQDPVTPDSLQSEWHNSLPRVEHGWSKERVDTYRRRPLNLDISQIAAHIDQSIRFAHAQPRIRDVLKILGAKFNVVDEDGEVIEQRTLSDSLNRIDPTLIKDTLIPWLDRAATQSLYRAGGDPTANAFWRFIRVNNGVATMMGSVVNAAQQITGLVSALNYVSAKRLFHGLTDLVKQRSGLTKWITAASPFMRDRLQNQVGTARSDLQELLTDPSWISQAQAWSTRKAYFLQAMVQNTVDQITWKGAYEATMGTRNDGESAEQHHARAVLEADSIVRLSQGSFSAEDVANYEVASPFMKTWFQFSGYFNNVLNSIGYSDRKVRAAVLGFSLPMIIASAIGKLLLGDIGPKADRGDDDDGLAWEAADVLILSQIKGAASLVPAWGPALSAFLQARVGTAPISGDRVATSPAIATLYRSADGLISAIAAAASDEREASGRTVGDFLTGITVLTGIPIAPLAKPAKYLVDVGRGKIEPSGPIDFARGLLTGRASNWSRR